MAPMFVKVCGLKTEADVAAAVQAGASAVGFVLGESVRKVDPDTARRLAAEVPPHVLAVGVVSGVPAAEAGRMCVEAGLGALQLHGRYARTDFDEVRDLPLRLIRAINLETDVTPEELPAASVVGGYGEEYLLLDSPVAGSGQRWDVSGLKALGVSGQWVLAGGLNPGNVAEAIAAADPWGVDVSSGVESSRGVKDQRLIRDFLAAALSARP
jgi:phosphoribosylanthranilate isomerase